MHGSIPRESDDVYLRIEIHNTDNINSAELLTSLNHRQVRDPLGSQSPIFFLNKDFLLISCAKINISVVSHVMQ